MRVLFLDNEFPPLGGGTGVVNEKLFVEFSKFDDLEIDLVTSSRSRKKIELHRFSDNITIHKVPVNNKNIHHSTWDELCKYALRGLRYSRTLISKSYHLSFAFAGVPAGGIAYALHKQYRLPYILSLQGPDIPGFEERYRFIYPWLRWPLRAIWGNAEKVLAISDKHQALALKFFPDCDIDIVENGVDTSEFHPGENSTPGVGIVCSGRLIKRKGQHDLIEALATIKDLLEKHSVTVHFVGTGDQETRLKQLVHTKGVDTFVRFHGFVPRNEMPQVYMRSHVFVLPSYSEGMSIALLEALATGLPVIVTDVGGTKELVEHGKGGFVITAGDIPALAEYISRLIEDAELRDKMSRINKLVAEEFSWSRIAQQYHRLFCEVARSDP